ncbi:cytochrome P450 [Variovorax ginsengisoli]|uniref:Cytochrome P450 n=1 Tax=Variovorax ginsengisoli TaxID=363844 RepID=A0ABT8SC81_9BURK|nr:cytochrome P450 [Variovorax ginsengisoli]MDN8617359.1 cytochrome P450 [Variovorax ginsengisoli]MDO1536529.1 cytochrome P450 [Variovorax ginsengisoli]
MSVATSTTATELDLDPFSADYILNPYPQHERLRSKAPVVWLERYKCYATGRYELVRAVLEDPVTFCSGAGVGLGNFNKEPPWRVPSMVLETDPPNHTRNRAVISRALSPATLRSLRDRFEREAQALVERVLAVGGTTEAVKDLGEAFPLKVFADAVGLREDGRENLIAYGNMVFNGMGPRNALYEQAMANADAVNAWVWPACQKEALAPGGLGLKIFEAVDSGLFSELEAATLVRSFLSAGIDTTANAIGLLLHCFARFPEQWDLLVGDPSLSRGAFDEVLRLESPFQTFFRTTTKDTELGGVRLGVNEKIMVSLGSANRDPNRWDAPETFDIRRATTGHVAFGAGIHGCVGQMMARLEVESLLRALVSRVRRVESAGEPRWMLHNTLRGLESLPLRLIA